MEKFRGTEFDLFEAAGMHMRTDLKAVELVKQGYAEQYGDTSDIEQFQADCTHSSSIPGFDASGQQVHFCLFCGMRR